ncbi:hypothetical protein H7F51_08490 [Novosphingobium flavum]|uniref:Uncharacterized protein n=1 Tax=Novosphingobium flavum TaxID=1778672 RepID=A0A7X1FRL9_9SPHN|nr:hypothetical protein [Novosphingobium flavum]MBC2665559.1 hypothetical protein [Novosphingobium flavum]
MTELWEAQLIRHPFVAGHPDLSALADRIGDLLGLFYQQAGHIALDPPAESK